MMKPPSLCRWVIVPYLVFLIFYVMAVGAGGQSLTVDRIYTDLVAPLQQENFQLRLQIMGLTDQIHALQKQLDESKLATPPPDPAK